MPQSRGEGRAELPLSGEISFFLSRLIFQLFHSIFCQLTICSLCGGDDTLFFSSLSLFYFRGEDIRYFFLALFLFN